MKIARQLTPFIASQFPEFYREDGPNFIAFMEAYYEWMEQQGNPIYESRSLYEYSDIDETLQQFISHFKYSYIDGIPDTALVDKRLLIKHAVDLYRAKGTERAVRLLMRLLFNEDAEVFIPNEALFRPSEASWYVPQYIEVTESPLLKYLEGKQITSSNGARAVVESYAQKTVNNLNVHMLLLSKIDGEFRYGDQIFSPDFNEVIYTSSSLVVGSLSAIAITNGGAGFKVGDELSVVGSGSHAVARVAAVETRNGKVQFFLNDGGYGFSLDANVLVTNKSKVYLADPSPFAVDDIVLDTNTAVYASVVKVSSNYIELAERSPSNGEFYPGDTLQLYNRGVACTGVNAAISTITTGYGSGASFRVGNIVDKRTLNFVSDIINPYRNTRMSRVTDGYRIAVDSATVTFSDGEVVTSSSNTRHLVVTSVSGNVQPGEALSNASLGISGLRVYFADGPDLYTTGIDATLNNANLVAGITMISNATSSVVTVGHTSPKVTVTGNGIVNGAATSASTVYVYNTAGVDPDVDGLGYFIPGGTLVGSTPLRSANIDVVERLTDWGGFPAAFSNSNLDSYLSGTLNYVIKTVGKITYLAVINPGSGYGIEPYVRVVEPLVYYLGIDDGLGGYWGYDAIVDTTAGIASGIVTGVQVIESGLGFKPNEDIGFFSPDNQTEVTGVAVVESHGYQRGIWRDSRSFISDTTYIQDSSYYQLYSYEIGVGRMIDTYRDLVRNLIHPSGMALYGRYIVKREVLEQNSIPVSSSLVLTG
jgi:hypothetical protein